MITYYITVIVATALSKINTTKLLITLAMSVLYLRLSMSCRDEKPRINSVSLLAGITIEDAMIAIEYARNCGILL